MPEASSKQSYTLVEKLRQLVETKRGDPMPPFLAHATNQWGMVLADTARQALELIEGETDPHIAKVIEETRHSVLVGGSYGSIHEHELETLIRAITNYRCRLATATALVKSLQDLAPLSDRPDWQSIDTAPVTPFEQLTRGHQSYAFKCLLQLKQTRPENPPWICEGEGYWVLLGRATTTPTLRWRCSIGQCFPKYWMPLPAPKLEGST